MTPSFNLLEQPWIPVIDTQGRAQEVNLKQVLTQGSEYTVIQAESPLETVAIYRLLLAILHRALEGPVNIDEREEWFESGFPNSQISSYLDKYQDRFDLCHPTHPFYQLPDIPFEGYQQHWSKLSVAEGAANTTAIFNPALRKYAPKELGSWITPAQAARKLLEHQTFALQTLIHKFIKSSPRCPSAKSALIMVKGVHVQETLCLNLASYKGTEKTDQPHWEKPPWTTAELKKDPKVFVEGYAQLYTWFSRSVRFQWETFDGELGVRHLAYASGVRFQAPDGFFEPMAAYVLNKKDEPSPLGLKEDKALWRDYQALLPNFNNPQKKVPTVINAALEVLMESEQAQTLRMMTFGQLTDQAKVLFWRHETYPLPPALLAQENVDEEVSFALETAEQTAQALNKAAQRLMRHLLSQGGREPDWNKDLKPVCQNLPHHGIFWSRLEQAFTRFIQSLEPGFHSGQVQAQWQQDVLNAGQEAWRILTDSLGQSSQTYKAAAKAQGVWLKQVKELTQFIQINTPEVTHAV